MKKHTQNIAKTIRKPKKVGTLISQKLNTNFYSLGRQNSDVTVNLTKMQQSFSSKLT